ncbi:hypothetical protein B296_00016800 [Ensete ventricosum]|uniref:Uncharacterized protein n=1 Tax=Ensete ventricosum TaxID=4639 RepID=A0A426YNC8_ENSVE|nr:hypothetical protein B296_00016800 [Ensete ventricosum]
MEPSMRFDLRALRTNQKAILARLGLIFADFVCAPESNSIVLLSNDSGDGRSESETETETETVGSEGGASAKTAFAGKQSQRY